MRRRAFLATAAAPLGATAAATATAGCLGTFSEPLDVQSYDSPGDAPAFPTPSRLPARATVEHVVTVGPVDERDPAPIVLAAYNAATDPRDVACSLTAGGDHVLDRTWTLDASGFAVVVLHAPADYLATVGYPAAEGTPIPIARNDFDCNAETVVATVASGGDVDVRRVSKDDGC